MSSRFHPKSRRLFLFYFSDITLRTDLLTFRETGAVFKIAGEMHRLPAYFDNPDQGSNNPHNCYFSVTFDKNDNLLYHKFFADVIWVILCVDEGGLLGLTQQLSTLGREMNSCAGSHPVSPSANPFGLSTPIGTSPQPIYSVPNNSPANGVLHISPARRSLFNSMVSTNNK